MPLTTQQETTLAVGIRASTDPVLVAALAIGDAVTITNWVNQAASPTIKAWRESVPIVEIDEAADYTVFDAVPAGKRDSWGFFLRFSRDFTRNKVRKWVTDIWGNATAGSSAESILLAAVENMTNGQQILGAGTVATTGTVSANKRTFAAILDITTVSLALNRNP